MLEILSATAHLHRDCENGTVTNIKNEQYKNIDIYMNNIFKSMEIIRGLTFLGLEFKADHEILRRKVTLEESYFFRVKAKFKFSAEGEEDQLFDLKVNIPELIDDNYFYIYGSRYSTLLRLNNYKPIHDQKDKYVLILIKTLINNFSVELKEKTNRRNQSFVKVFTKNVNIGVFLILVCDRNLELFLNRTFGEDGWEACDLTPDIKKDFEYDKNIMFKDKYIKIKNVEDWQEKIITSFNAIKLSYSRLMENNEYVTRLLGKNYSTNSNTFLEKGEVVLSTVNRSLDNITSGLLNVDNLYDLFVNEIKKSTDGNVADYNETSEKKFKFLESILYPLYKRISDNIYIYLNSRRKNINNVFKINENIVIKHITTTEAIQYHDLTNSFDTFIKDKVTLMPMGVRKEKIGKEVRELHPSQLEFLDLFSSPNGKSTGLSTFIVPLQHEYFVSDNETIIT